MNRNIFNHVYTSSCVTHDHSELRAFVALTVYAKAIQLSQSGQNGYRVPSMCKSGNQVVDTGKGLSVSIFPRNDAIRWPAFGKHVADVLHKLLRPLDRSEMASRLMLRLEDHLSRRTDPSIWESQVRYDAYARKGLLDSSHSRFSKKDDFFWEV